MVFIIGSVVQPPKMPEPHATSQTQSLPSSTRFWRRRSPIGQMPHLVEMVYSGGIPAGDLGLLLLGTIHQNFLKDLAGPWEGRFWMGIV